MNLFWYSLLLLTDYQSVVGPGLFSHRERLLRSPKACHTNLGIIITPVLFIWWVPISILWLRHKCLIHWKRYLPQEASFQLGRRLRYSPGMLIRQSSPGYDVCILKHNEFYLIVIELGHSTSHIRPWRLWFALVVFNGWGFRELGDFGR
jgi:hypothetical protein